VELTWLGHSCFRLRGRDVTIVTDPYSSEDWQYPPLSTEADVVTISNDHPHHSCGAAVQRAQRLIRGPGEYELGGAMILGVRTPRLVQPGDGTSSKNTVFLIQLEELTICHLGDLGKPLTTEQLAPLKDCDVVLVPVGGGCTIGASEAAAVVAQIEPKVIVPMHYATDETAGVLALDRVERFCREMGAADVQPQARLSVTPATLPNEPTVVLLERRQN
jgi:L-ascorbate metabolism protein UlaG (beta-lactamase superfamily)